MHEFFFKTIDSTNLFAKNNAKKFSPSCVTCITADEQTQGYGQAQRKWISPKDVNLYTTFFFIVSKKTQDLHTITLKMALCLKKVLESEDIKATLKWPNDVLVNEKKIAGILCETIIQKEWIEVILGFGLNINMTEDQLSYVDQKATSMRIETKRTFDKNALLKKIQNEVLMSLITHYNPEIVSRA